MSNEKPIGAIILAAGSSSRLGRPKQFIEFNGDPLLKRVLDSVQSDSAIGPIAIVIGAYEEALLSRADSIDVNGRAQWITNVDWQDGMGKSIAVGMQFLLESFSNMQGVLVSVCDQPHLDHFIINRLVRSFEENPGSIIASSYDDTLGPPVVFPQSDFETLANLAGTSGAKSILRKQRERVVVIDFPGGGLDLDTEQDLDRMHL